MVNKVYVSILEMNEEDFLNHQNILFDYGLRWNSEKIKEYRDIRGLDYIIIEDGVIYTGSENLKTYLNKNGFTQYSSLNELFRFIKLLKLKSKIKSTC